MLSFGLVEVKCIRCGRINNLHSYDTLIDPDSDAYVLAYDSFGRIMAASDTVERALGYSQRELQGVAINTIRPEQPVAHRMYSSLKDWEDTFNRQPETTVHTTKTGSQVTVEIHYYPVVSHAGISTIAICYIQQPTIT